MRLFRTDELANNSEVQSLHEVLTIYAATNGAKETMFTWGDLTAAPIKATQSVTTD